MSWDDLEVDGNGIRPGHPLLNRRVITTTAAAKRLETSANTVRALVVEGALGGYWRRAPQRMIFAVYDDEVGRYLRRYGPLNHMRRDRHASRSSLVRADLRPAGHGQQLSDLAASLADIAARVSALERETRTTGASEPESRRSDLDWERRRRLELEDALAALQEDDRLVAEADALQQQAYAKLRSAHQNLRSRVSGVRQPRSLADMEPESGSASSEF